MASNRKPSQSRHEQPLAEITSKSQPRRTWWSFINDVTPSEWELLILSTAIKLLLFPAYRSTDFEVHRNWLAITRSLPISKWYYDTTSEWTLDYPPFFAYFEWILSIPAYFVDKKIVDLNNLNYGAWTVVAYQRTTVILTELVLGAVLLKFTRSAVDQSTQRIISASLFFHPGFLIVDHIHFQYNGFMYGILLWSIYMAQKGDKLACGLLFAVLLNFKHIYMYQAPAYFVYLLRSYCMTPQGDFLFHRFLSLANVVIAVFVVSIGPFFLMGQLPQLLSRLFPFKRGLNHAYWAPNAWALVTALDRVLLKVIKITGANLEVNSAGMESTSRGLVGDTVFAVIPNIKPIHTFLITIAIQSVFLAKLWTKPTYKTFLTSLTLCGYVSYMFGWHVHEKAILLVLAPLSLLATDSYALNRTFSIASVAGIYSLFPLLFTPMESFVKVAYSCVWAILVLKPLNQRLYDFPTNLAQVIIDFLERAYLGGFVLLHVVVTALPLLSTRSHGTEPATCIPSNTTSCPQANPASAGSSSMEFLPLMLTSVYCAIGITWAFLRLSALYIFSSK